MKFDTDPAIIAYVTDELKHAMPKGWVARQRLRYRSLDKPAAEITIEDLEWHIARPEENLSSLHEYYLARVSGDRRTISVTHSNSDAGSGWIPMETMSVIDCNDVGDLFPLRRFIVRVMASFRPNVQGLS